MLQRIIWIIIILLLVIPSMAQNVLDMTELLDDYADEGEAAIVLYIHMDELEWVGANGLANIDTGLAAQTDDLFRIGSVTKPLVSTIILQLVQEGELELDKPIADYVSNEITTNIENVDSATLRNMLQMTSGIYSYTETDEFNDAAEDDPSHWWTAAEILTSIYDYEADFAPETDYYYSNSNYILAQIIIESITDNSLADELENRVFAPLGMDSCYLETEDIFGQDIVRGYADYGDGLEDITLMNDGIGLGDGGVVCTAADLAKFMPALLTAELIDETTLAMMLQTTDDGEGGEYGLGMGIEQSEFGQFIGHDGATSGFQSIMIYVPNHDINVVVLTNNFDSEIVFDLAYDAIATAVTDD